MNGLPWPWQYASARLKKKKRYAFLLASISRSVGDGRNRLCGALPHIKTQKPQKKKNQTKKKKKKKAKKKKNQNQPQVINRRLRLVIVRFPSTLVQMTGVLRPGRTGLVPAVRLRSSSGRSAPSNNAGFHGFPRKRKRSKKKKKKSNGESSAVAPPLVSQWAARGQARRNPPPRRRAVLPHLFMADRPSRSSQRRVGGGLLNRS